MVGNNSMTRRYAGSYPESRETAILEIVNESDSSVEFEYTNIASSAMNNSEVGIVKLRVNSEGGTTPVPTKNFYYGSGNPYQVVNEKEQNISDLFTKPIVNKFTNLPNNTKELNHKLYEDLDGDGDSLETEPVAELSNNLDNISFSKKQALSLNWDEGSPKYEVTQADMTELFGEKIRG